MTNKSPQKIILVATNTRHRNLVFVSDLLKVLPIEQAVKAVRAGSIKGAYAVHRKSGTYLRTYLSIPKHEEFETISITGHDILSYAHGAHAVSTPVLSRYLEIYLKSLKEGEPLITPVGEKGVPTVLVKKKLTEHRSHIFAVAEYFDIDPYLLGAIIIDEIARLAPFEEIINALGGNIVGLNVSIGIAQVKIDTTNDLIKKGVYHPNPNDKKLPYRQLTNLGRMHLYDYLIQPKHNIFFVSANMRFIIDFWASHIDLTDRPEIVTTLYSKGSGVPKNNPVASDRGLQVADEFYPLAKKWLSQ